MNWLGQADQYLMSFIERALVGNRISDVLADSEVTYVMLENGTQITIRGLVVVEPLPNSMPLVNGHDAVNQRQA
jgi:hypothetical protein